MNALTSHDVYHELRRVAKARGLDTQQQFELYVHEAFLARVAKSQYSEQLVLKGGMLVAAMGIRRATRDADFLAVGIANDEGRVREVVKEIAGLDLSDGISFDGDSIQSQIVRQQDDYQSIRVSMVAVLNTAKLKLKLDINFSDPVFPTPIVYPSMLDRESFTLLAYPQEMVVAEKVETMMARGETNTRDRDFADVYLLIKSGKLNQKKLKRALEDTARHRGRDLIPLSRALGSIGTVIRSQDWLMLCQRSGLSGLPREFAEVTQAIIAYMDPIIGGGELSDESRVTLEWQVRRPFRGGAIAPGGKLPPIAPYCVTVSAAVDQDGELLPGMSWLADTDPVAQARENILKVRGGGTAAEDEIQIDLFRQGLLSLLDDPRGVHVYDRDDYVPLGRSHIKEP